jgi:hypothetical protein
LWVPKVIVSSKSIVNLLNCSGLVGQGGDFIFRRFNMNNGLLVFNVPINVQFTEITTKMFDYYNLVSTGFCLPKALKNFKYKNYFLRTFIYY